MNPLLLDSRRTALVLIDLQQGIVNLPTAPRSGSDVVSQAVRLADRFRQAAALVVLVHVGFSSDGRDALRPEADTAPHTGPFPANWMDFIPEVGPKPGDLVILKRQWGAFHGTELDLQLRRRGIDTIVLGGIATHIGVESTARHAYELGYRQVLVEDAMTSLHEEPHANAIRYVFPRLGHVRSTAEVEAACASWKP